MPRLFFDEPDAEPAARGRPVVAERRRMAWREPSAASARPREQERLAAADQLLAAALTPFSVVRSGHDVPLFRRPRHARPPAIEKQSRLTIASTAQIDATNAVVRLRYGPVVRNVNGFSKSAGPVCVDGVARVFLARARLFIVFPRRHSARRSILPSATQLAVSPEKHRACASVIGLSSL